jgi:hypothetical protein
MKNLFLVYTDKPSYLTLRHKNNDILFSTADFFYNNKILDTKINTNFNLYVTSNEETKEGDWVYFKSTSEIIIVPEGGFKENFCKKIILTTDPDLIKDGIQKIPNKFIEDYIQNPNLEYIDVDSININTNVSHYKIVTHKKNNSVKIQVFCGTSIEDKCRNQLHPLNEVKKAKQIIDLKESISCYSNSTDFISTIKYYGQKHNIETEFFLNNISCGDDIELIFKDFNESYKFLNTLCLEND